MTFRFAFIYVKIFFIYLYRKMCVCVFVCISQKWSFDSLLVKVNQDFLSSSAIHYAIEMFKSFPHQGNLKIINEQKRKKSF